MKLFFLFVFLFPAVASATTFTYQGKNPSGASLLIYDYDHHKFDSSWNTPGTGGHFTVTVDDVAHTILIDALLMSADYGPDTADYPLRSVSFELAWNYRDSPELKANGIEGFDPSRNFLRVPGPYAEGTLNAPGGPLAAVNIRPFSEPSLGCFTGRDGAFFIHSSWSGGMAGSSDIYELQVSSDLELSSAVDATEVPEPSTLLLLGLGAIGFLKRRWGFF